MSAPAAVILGRLQELGVTVRVDGDALRVKPASLVPPDLMAELRAHKPELLALLQQPHPARPKTVDAPHEWHAEQVARRVEAEALCIFWSETFKELVAFVKDDRYKGQVPAGVVTYTRAELDKLYPDGSAPLDPVLLLRVHRAKLATGGTVIETTNERHVAETKARRGE